MANRILITDFAEAEELQREEAPRTGLLAWLRRLRPQAPTPP